MSENSKQKTIADFASESAFSEKDWKEAADIMQGWLKANNRELDETSILEYIDCCAAAIAASPRYESLAESTADFLKEHGCENARPLTSGS